MVLFLKWEKFEILGHEPKLPSWKMSADKMTLLSKIRFYKIFAHWWRLWLSPKNLNFSHFKERTIMYILGKKIWLHDFFFYFWQYNVFYVLSLWSGPRINGDILQFLTSLLFILKENDKLQSFFFFHPLQFRNWTLFSIFHSFCVKCKEVKNGRHFSRWRIHL